MTTTTTTSKKPTSPDDLCGVCQTTRENHGDRNHQFSMEGNLVPIEVGPEPRQAPPKEKGEALSPEAEAVTKEPGVTLNLRMIERLTAKGIFDGEDLVYIFGGKL